MLFRSLVGHLELTRERPGSPIERLDLSEMVGGEAEVPGFERPAGNDKLWDEKGIVRPMTEIVRRPHVDLLDLRDFDHDGLAAEFLYHLPVGLGSCAAFPVALVGVSRGQMQLHDFGITLRRSQWKSVLDARGASVDLVITPCNEGHGLSPEFATVHFDPAHGMRIDDDPRWECRDGEPVRRAGSR